MQPVIVQRGRTVIVGVSLGFDVSGDSFSSQIRVTQSLSSALIATWAVTFATDGKDGELILTLSYTITAGITQSVGYMDLRRVSGGVPLPVFSNPSVLEVSIVDVPTG